MKLQHLNEETIKKAAELKFKDFVVQLDTTDLFLKDIQDGTYTTDFLTNKMYVSTQYGYEDILVNGNPTRYKIHFHTIELLDAAYTINYNWKDRYYAVYEEHGEIQFMKYPEFLEFIKKRIHQEES